MPTAKMPRECDYLMKHAASTGVLGRRGSKSTEAWNVAQGHGIRSYAFSTGGVDAPKNNKSVDDEFMKDKTNEQKEKIRKLKTRMSMKGALNVTGINEAEVRAAKEEDLQKRKSRRAEHWVH